MYLVVKPRRMIGDMGTLQGTFLPAEKNLLGTGREAGPDLGYADSLATLETGDLAWFPNLTTQK